MRIKTSPLSRMTTTNSLTSLLFYLALISMSFFSHVVDATNFTIINGQTFTPGLAIIDAPQPGTPEGGDYLQLALDISFDGKLTFPSPSNPNPSSPSNTLHNITLYLTSYITGLNLTISNGTTALNPPNASLGNILAQEPSSTVKHVNWIWPSCLVGTGAPSPPPPSFTSSSTSTSASARGSYNITIHQSFTLLNTSTNPATTAQFYTIFDLPIEVTNEIPATPGSVPVGLPSQRPVCAALMNGLLSPEEQRRSADEMAPNQYPFVSGDAAMTDVPASSNGASPSPSPSPSATAMGTTTSDTGSSGGVVASVVTTADSTATAAAGVSGGGEGDIGPEKPDAGPGTGLGSGAFSIKLRRSSLVWKLVFAIGVYEMLVWGGVL